MRKDRATLLLFLALLPLFISRVEAQSWTNAPSLPGFEDQPGRPGLSVPGGIINVSAPVIAELDGNPQNGKEIVAASADGYVHAYRSDGSKLWTAKTPNYKCGGETNRIHSSPAVGDLLGMVRQRSLSGMEVSHSFVPVGLSHSEARPGDSFGTLASPDGDKKRILERGSTAFGPPLHYLMLMEMESSRSRLAVSTDGSIS